MNLIGGQDRHPYQYFYSGNKFYSMKDVNSMIPKQGGQWTK